MVQRYLLYMEMSYQVPALPAWSANLLKRLVKAPKILFLDLEVLKAILKKTEVLRAANLKAR
jgi:predicted AAA+ superfamily ATPase